MLAKLDDLRRRLEGDLFTDRALRTLYATDASVYREMPLAVARPKHVADLKELIAFADKMGLGLIPRTAGTSLGGQVVGSGIVVDVSKHFTGILEVNVQERWVRVEPGVVRDELNAYLKPYGLFFGPETSTSNRAMIGGMVGNNSCGSHSLIYGTTRDNTLALKAILSDGKEVEFADLTPAEFAAKCELTDREGELYRFLQKELSDKANQQEIRDQFPHPQINRRNTGYAIDVVLESELFTPGAPPINLSKLICGSEGTLAFVTEAKLKLEDLPLPHVGVVAVHCETLTETFEANLVALRHKPGAVELIDDFVIRTTRSSPSQAENRFFIEGNPGGLLVVEFACATEPELDKKAAALIADMKQAGYGFSYPILKGADVGKVWKLRSAGLGTLSNIPGDPKPVACIEDTAVRPEDLPAYLAEFKGITDKYGKPCVYYAHIGDGEIHLRPILDLKQREDQALFERITDDVAALVKKYRGSMSGEHGDGRVRGPFVKKMVGERNYELLRQLKAAFDPKGIFNPGKIVDTPPMTSSLRYEPNQKTVQPQTILDFGLDQGVGILRLAEQCNGSGDCRKSALTGGTMCPSYMATRNERDTTRARANVLREFLTRSEKPNKFDHEEIKEVMDLCLSCKGCQAECPSNVDVAQLKAEFLQHYYDANGTPLRAKLIGDVAKANATFSKMPWLYNATINAPLTGDLVRAIMGFSRKRKLPLLHNTTLRAWAQKHPDVLIPVGAPKGKVYFFADEVIDYNDVPIGQAAIELLSGLGYQVVIPQHRESGRPNLSKGRVRAAQKAIRENFALLKDKVSEATPLIGLEPSAILTFRDEMPKLVEPDDRPAAAQMGKHCLLLEEFLVREAQAGRISSENFLPKEEEITFHGHCHQKAIAGVSATQKALALIPGVRVKTLATGCCGMSGSFGYEKEHYEVSMQIGELVLFPLVRKLDESATVCAPGTSCRHQIKDGTGRRALHPAEILRAALKPR